MSELVPCDALRKSSNKSVNDCALASVSIVNLYWAFLLAGLNLQAKYNGRRKVREVIRVSPVSEWVSE